jgi:hydrogenase maturation protease
MAKGRTVVIGYGNPLRQDDGIGWRAAELLEQALPAGSAEIIQCHQLTAELAANLEGASVVVFLDAACDQEPGAISSTPVYAEGAVVWSHYLTPGQLLRLSEQLGGEAPPAVLIRGGIQHRNQCEGLTELGEKTASDMADLAQACCGADTHVGSTETRTETRLVALPGASRGEPPG